MEEKRLLNDIFETIGLGIFITDLKGELIGVNKNLADILLPCVTSQSKTSGRKI